MNNTVLLMIRTMPKVAIKLETVSLDKTYPDKSVLRFISLVNNTKIKNDEQQTSFGAKLHID